MNDIEWLQRWYASCCDGKWEHAYGVKIDTLDNPGWSLEIDLEETDLEGVPFAEIREGTFVETFPDPDLSSWQHCKVENSKFIAFGGADDLEAIVLTFVEWAEGVAPA